MAQTYDHVIIAGDFNVDFTKPSPNRMVLQCFMQDFDLDRGDAHSDISFTYRRDDHLSTSWVDHIVCSSAIVNNFNSINTQDSIDNFSDHVPMFFTLKLSNLSPHYIHLPTDQTNSTTDPLPSRINWNNIY